MNPAEQKAHTAVTAELRVECEQLWSAIADLENVVMDRLEAVEKQREADERQALWLASTARDQAREALTQHAVMEQMELHDQTAPLRRDFLGRLRWFLRGD